MKLSIRGERLSGESGTLRLMEDLGRAMAEGDQYMLGGGNPALIPEVMAVWKQRVRELLEEGPGFDRMLGCYDSPRGNPEFIKCFAQYARNRLRWPVEEQNIVITGGSQGGFFNLFNLLAGEKADGGPGRILRPISPEYIGYANQHLDEGVFHSLRPLIEETTKHGFKYRIDFEALREVESASLICLSRPTNPSGNVVAESDLHRLYQESRRLDIPLVLDNAYGIPFPGIIFGDVKPFWKPGIISTFSLSKLGLPATRTGIMVGPEELISRIVAMNANTSLAIGSIGQALIAPMLNDGSLDKLCKDVIRPYYRARLKDSLAALEESFKDRFEYRVHETEGSMFLWIWFPKLRCTDLELYHKLKCRKVLVIPGSFFFFGLQSKWPHSHQCIRVNYSHDPVMVRKGLEIIADTVAKNC